MRRLTLLITAVLIGLPASTQDPAPPGCAPQQCDRTPPGSEMQPWSWRLEQDWASWDFERAQKQRAEQERREFVRRMNHFAEIWNKFVSEYNNQGTFNVTNAQALTKAFREVQAMGWPK